MRQRVSLSNSEVCSKAPTVPLIDVDITPVNCRLDDMPTIKKLVVGTAQEAQFLDLRVGRHGLAVAGNFQKSLDVKPSCIGNQIEKRLELDQAQFRNKTMDDFAVYTPEFLLHGETGALDVFFFGHL